MVAFFEVVNSGMSGVEWLLQDPASLFEIRMHETDSDALQFGACERVE